MLTSINWWWVIGISLGLTVGVWLLVSHTLIFIGLVLATWFIAWSLRD